MSTLPPRILVVDDYRDAADVLAQLLSMHGMEVQAAYGGEEAISLATTFLPHIILLDIGMPAVDGYQVARTLRRDLPAQPFIIALTAWNDAETLRRVQAAGMDQHVAKPSSLECLLALIQSNAPVATQRPAPSGA